MLAKNKKHVIKYNYHNIWYKVQVNIGLKKKSYKKKTVFPQAGPQPSVMGQNLGAIVATSDVYSDTLNVLTAWTSTLKSEV